MGQKSRRHQWPGKAKHGCLLKQHHAESGPYQHLRSENHIFQTGCSRQLCFAKSAL